MGDLGHQLGLATEAGEVVVLGRIPLRHEELDRDRRPRATCRARKTSPIPPLPSRSRSRSRGARALLRVAPPPGTLLPRSRSLWTSLTSTRFLGSMFRPHAEPGGRPDQIKVYGAGTARKPGGKCQRRVERARPPGAAEFLSSTGFKAPNARLSHFLFDCSSVQAAPMLARRRGPGR